MTVPAPSHAVRSPARIGRNGRTGDLENDPCTLDRTMTRSTRYLLLLLFGGLLSAGPALAQVLPDPAARYVPGEVLLKFHPGAKSADRQRVLAGLDAEPVARPDKDEPRRYLLGGLEVEEALRRYGQDPALVYIEPNWIWTLAAVPDDPGFSQQWGLRNTGQEGGLPGADIGAVEAWDRIADARSVRVGVVDSGVDYLHEDLRENLWINPGEIAGNGLDDDGNGFIDDVYGYDFAEGDGDPYDELGHGTHVAGTIAAVGSNGRGVTGVSWRAELVTLRAMNAQGEGTTEAIVQAIDYGIARGVEILNNSYGGNQDSAALAEAVTRAQAAGVLFVAAAGNSRQNVEYVPFYPACYPNPNIVSVGASDRRDQLVSTLRWGSNYGPVSVDLLAPGDQIYSTLPGDSYGLANGTSMATPHVAGALALTMARRPSLTPDQARRALLDGAAVLPQLEGTCATEARLWLPPLVVAPDSTAPPAIDDLEVVGVDGDRIELAWTAVGDMDTDQAAASYDLRWSTAPLDETGWASATEVAGEPAPGPAGSSESLLVAGLRFDTTYYFGIRAIDAAGNVSPPGWAPPVTTLGAPELVLEPPAVTVDLGSGVRTDRTVRLRNGGEGSLAFEIADPRLGTPGRSDGHGHVWSGSDDDGGPGFAWDEIVPGGTLVLAGQDEAVAGPFDLGFEFPFYDRTFSRLWISSNGFVTFAATAPAAQNLPLPGPEAPAYLIAPFWTDLDPGAGGGVFLDTRADRVIVEFFGVVRRGGEGPHTFQVHLLADGTIEFQYLTLQQPGEPVTVGIQGPAGGPGLQIVHDEDFLRDGLALRIAPIPSWLTVEPRTGRIGGGEALDLALGLDAADLCGPQFLARVPLATNDPATPDAELTVTANVSGQPYLALETRELDFGRVEPGATARREVRLRNAGCGSLTIAEILPGSDALTITPGSLVLAPGDGAILQAVYAPTRVELVTGELLLSSDDPGQPLRSIPFRAQAAEAPLLELAAVDLSDTLRVGQRAVHAIPVANPGGGELEIVLEADAPWIVPRRDTVRVAIDRTDTLRIELAAGESCDSQLEALLTLTTNDPLQPVLDLPVSLRVERSMRLAAPDEPLEWGEVYVGATVTRDLVLANAGCEPLAVSRLECSDAQFAVPDSAFVLPPGQNRSLPVTFAPAGTGAQSAELIVHSDDPDHPTAAVPLLGSGRAAPRLAFEPPALYVPAVPGQVSGHTVTIRNDGADTLRVVPSTTADWLTATADSLAVPAGARVELALVVDADGRCGRQEVALLRLASNDPASPQGLAPVTLDVSLAPDVEVAPDTLRLPTLFVGQTGAVELQVSNRGCLALEWGTPARPDPDLSLVGDLGRLEPGRTREWTLTWTPGAAGELSGSLRLPSNDPDEPEVTVALVGRAQDPPRAQVTATGLDASLLTGARSDGRILLRNEGGSDLTWALTTEAGPVTGAAPAHMVIACGRPLAPRELASLADEGIPLQRSFEFEDLPDRLAEPERSRPGPKAASTAGSETETFGSMQNRYSGDNRSRGNLYHCTTATTLREHRLYLETPVATQMWLLVYEGLDPSGRYELVSASDLSPAGPGEGWYGSGQVDVPLRADHYYLLLASFATTCGYYNEEDLAEYPVPASFGELILGAGYDWSPVTEFPPRREQSVTGPFDSPVAYYQQVVTGEGTGWLHIDPRGGVLAPGAQIELDVVLDADGLCEPEYPARIQLWTNDPQRELVELSSQLLVQAAPDLRLSTDRLDFGLTYPERPLTLALGLTNPGCDPVAGTIGAAGSQAFSLAAGAFTLEPGAARSVEIVFDPVEPGIFQGEIEIASNDPDRPLHTVELRGESRPAPVLAHQPSALVDTVEWGVLETVPVQLTNSGGSDLDFQIVIDPKLPGTPTGPDRKRDPRRQAAAGLGRILVMEADTGQRYYERAMQNLDLQHTYINSYVELGYALNGGEAWDLVIVNNYADFPDAAAIADLTGYVSSGRPLILADWIFGDYSNQAIATRLGVEFEANLFAPDDFATRDPEHGLFRFPNRIAAWQWTDDQGTRDGQVVAAAAGAAALAGYASYPGAATIIQNAGRNGLFNAFQPVNFNGDDDGDGKLDMVELCENQILYLIHQLDWLKVEPGQGTIAPGESLEVQVTYDGSRIFGGWLEAELRLLSNDPRRREKRIPVTLGLAGVSPVQDEHLPRAFALADAAPNPFNPSTTIAFELPRDAFVQLKIYDVRGSLVATLLEEERPAGRHAAVWNGRDRADRAVASGVYFSRIQAGEWSATRRMTLLK